MNSLTTDIRIAHIQNVSVSEDTLLVDLADGRSISAPLAWYPRLLNGLPRERNNWRLIGGGEGIHWPDLDEDISAENIVFGQPSGEGQPSFNTWLSARNPNKKISIHNPEDALTSFMDLDAEIYALLDAAKINSIGSLSTQKPQKLKQLLAATRLEKGLQTRMPNMKEINEWIKNAKNLSRAYNK